MIHHTTHRAAHPRRRRRNSGCIARARAYVTAGCTRCRIARRCVRNVSRYTLLRALK